MEIFFLFFRSICIYLTEDCTIESNPGSEGHAFPRRERAIKATILKLQMRATRRPGHRAPVPGDCGLHFRYFSLEGGFFMATHDSVSVRGPVESLEARAEKRQAVPPYREPQLFAIGTAVDLMRSNSNGNARDSKQYWVYP